MIIKIVFSYLGTNFHGSAENTGVRTVVGELRKVLQKLLGFDIKFDLAGRTDAGVHALAQAVSFLAPSDWCLARFKCDSTEEFCLQLKRRAIRLLPSDISISEVTIEHDDFSARFSAKSREYKYIIKGSKDFVVPAFETNNCWIINNNLDVLLMEVATKLLVGEHDFASFSKADENRTTVRTVFESNIIAVSSNHFEYQIIGNAFCWQMVRGIVGSLFEVGSNKMSLKYFADMINLPLRSKIRTIAPPQGLYLWKVSY